MKYTCVLVFYLMVGLFWCPSSMSQDLSLIMNHKIAATDAHGTIRFGLILPPSYGEKNKNYPVIFYLHGLNGDYMGWQAQKVAEFFKTHSMEGDIPECIMVFPDGKEGFWCDHNDGDPLLEREIIDFIIPYIDKQFASDASKRLIMGWSSGGLGAMYLFAKHPGLFMAAISLDGSILSWEEFVHFQGERSEIINNSTYFYEYCSPDKWVLRNEELITEKQDTTIFLAAAFFIKPHQNFLEILKDSRIPYYYRELGCSHEFGCVFSEISSDLISFLKKTLD